MQCGIIQVGNDVAVHHGLIFYDVPTILKRLGKNIGFGHWNTPYSAMMNELYCMYAVTIACILDKNTVI